MRHDAISPTAAVPGDGPPRPGGPSPLPGPLQDRVLLAATLLSGVAALIGAGWLTGVLPSFYTGGDYAPLAGLIGERTTTVLHTVVALTGVAAGIAGRAGALRPRALIAVGVAQVAVFGLGAGSIGTLAAVGYLIALAMPAVIVALLVRVVRAYPRLRWTLGVPALAVVVAGTIATGVGIAGVIRAAGAPMAGRAWALGVVLLLLVLATTWGAVVVRTAGASSALARTTAWVLRHRRALTIVAATGPLPYALIRLTWLTPWPVSGPADLDMTMRVWGLLLSSGAWAGALLTIGLIRPWGETFPRWVPGLAGRTVPVAAVAVPGGLVAATVTFAAVPLLAQFVGAGVVSSLLGALVLPCWYWGPTLALAVWGYVAHRRSDPGTRAPGDAPDHPGIGSDSPGRGRDGAPGTTNVVAYPNRSEERHVTHRTHTR